MTELEQRLRERARSCASGLTPSADERLMLAAADALARQSTMRSALEKCRDRFREYEASHAAKAKSATDIGEFFARQDKSNSNREMAELCDEALSEPETEAKRIPRFLTGSET